MSPADLRKLNVALFQSSLDRTADPQERARIERLMGEERNKTDSEYPVGHLPTAPAKHLQPGTLIAAPVLRCLFPR